MSNDLLQKAIQLAKSQNREAAIPLLVHIIKAEPENVEAWRSLLDLLADDQRRAVLAALVQKNLGGPAAREVLDQISAEDLKPYLAGIGDGGRDVDLDAPVALAVDAAQDDQAQWLPESEASFAQVDLPAQGPAGSPPTPLAGEAIELSQVGDADLVGGDGSGLHPEQSALEAADASGQDAAPESLSAERLAAAGILPANIPPEPAVLEKANAWRVEWLGAEAVPDPVREQPAKPLPAAAGPGASEPVTRRARRRSQVNCLVLAAVGLLVLVAVAAGLAMLSLRGLINLGFIPFIPAPAGLAAPSPSPSAAPALVIPPSATAALPTAPDPTSAPSATLTPTDLPPPTLTPTAFAGQVIPSTADGASQAYIPAGTFLMGWNYGDPGETTEHEVSLDAFWMDLTEVTNQMYAACVSAGTCTPPAETKSYKRAAYYDSPEFAAFPVVFVTWQQANDYCAWAGRRLPSEAEWEFAARGQDQRLFPWGKNEPVRELANFSFFNKDTTQVGLFPDGASPFGVLDMAGNVSEWVADWYIENYYSKSPQDNPAGPAEGSVKAFRGGSFANQADKIRSTRRGFDAPAYVNPSLGFRCAQDAP